MLRAGIDRKYAFVLLAASGVLLALGITFRPGQVTGEAVRSEIELARLNRLTEQRRLRDLSSFLNEAANQAATGLVSVLPSRATGLLWGNPPGVLIARGTADPESLTAVAWDGSPHAVQHTGSDPNQPFELLAVTPSAVLTAHSPAVLVPAPGDWVLAVARGPSNEALFAHGLYQGLSAARCGEFVYQAMQTSIPISDALTGGGVFTIDGQLLGFVARCEGRPIMIAAAAIDQALRMPTPLETRLEREYGMLLAKADPDGSRLITGVWADSRAAQAGLRPGDILASASDLERWVNHPGEEHEVEVRRQGRAVTLILSPRRTSLAASTLGITLADDAQSGAVIVHAVAPDSAGMQAGLRSGDVLERVSNAPVRDAASASAGIERARDAAITLVVVRGGKRLEVLVTP